MTYGITNAVLRLDADPVLEAVGDAITLVPDATGGGVFLRAAAPENASAWSVQLGAIAALDRFTACARTVNPFWMEPSAGSTTDEVLGDTQWLLARRTDGRFVLLVPLIDGAARFCLLGRDGRLWLGADTADPETTQAAGIAAYLAVGTDPYALQEQGAAAVLRHLQTGRLRRDKPLPDFVDLFGWCTWDAFYRDVSAEAVRRGLESLRDGGIAPRLLILDDGWLSVRSVAEHEKRLTAFAANDKFPGGLAPLVAAAKQQFGVRRVLAWHAVLGYWDGIEADRFPAYPVRVLPRHRQIPFGADLSPLYNWLGARCAVIAPEALAAFYDAFHAALAAEGVDGVKVDNQGTIELSVAGLGGRVRYARACRQGLEHSCRKHFGGRLINCMSCPSEMFYLAEDSTVMRTSTDFWPNLPETHGAHLYTNAQVGIWFGQFVHPDWDMFQSGHAMGAYHAAGRAVSGSPVYVSDKPGEHDFEVLRKLVCADGTVLRCTDVGRPSPDCLFRDPTREDVLLKIFNFNPHGAVLGLFHAKYDGGRAAAIAGTVSLADLPGLPPGRYAVLTHRSGDLRLLGPGDTWPVRLEPGQWEIFTFAPIHGETAVLGLADKYNSGGAVGDLRQETGRAEFRVRDGGSLVLYAACPPLAVTLDGVAAAVSYDAATGKAVASLPAAGTVVIERGGAGPSQAR